MFVSEIYKKENISFANICLNILFLGLKVEIKTHPKSHNDVWWISESDYEKLKNFLDTYSKSERRKLLRTKTDLQKHQVPYYTNREKCAKTKEERYNDSRYNNPQKTKKTNLEKYGCITPIQNEEIKEKNKETNREKYGFDWAQQSPILKENRYKKYNAYNPRKKYIFENEHFDSLWEIYFYIYNKYILCNNIRRGKRFFYYIDNKEHFYECDFLINKTENIEIKGDHFLNENDELINPFTKQILKEKTDCMRRNNVKIIKKKEIVKILKILKKELLYKLEEIKNG